MALIVLCSAKGSPGVTTTSLALGWAWPQAQPGRRSLVVDADPAGSGMLPGLFQANVPSTGGILALAGTAGGVGADELLANAFRLDDRGERLVMPGIADPAQGRALTGMWPQLAHAAREADVDGIDVLVDLGRLGHRNQPSVLLDEADLVVVVLRSTLESIAAARPSVRHLQDLRGAAGVIVGALVGDRRPYGAAEIATEVGFEIPLEIEHDAASARVFSDGIGSWSRLSRSPLIRSASAGARGLAAGIAAMSLDGVRGS
ncbi:hypothetical protein [Pengzhenrongella sicca]|uniref:Uncharacterized protein n=1 Tax=Pengzhenrongella sicca TaxID=2819238 RepID=A0A8A4ZDH9_9MICO|nr:hypothetical protein [Pengzhenrongella sicca]QTE30040.1 hypothetical protein J4E96_03175 [Pengzhenrongella sicca]